MFPKGPRFQPLKVPDVPGPNTYNIPQDSMLDNYKRGAFLEKTDRFMKEKEPIHTAPPAVTDTQKPKPQADTEHYKLLQRKVEDLERVHLEGKKAHQAELERLKQDLAASQKSSAESTERFEKQKKQNALLEARVQELKKAGTSDQSELKDLRHKLRVLELERDKSSSKHSEIAELKKSLATLEAKRKDELKDRDRHIVELEKLLQTEKKKRETLESTAQESKLALEEEANSKRTVTQEMEGLLHSAREESQIAKAALHNIENAAATREDTLLQQLQQHRCLLNTVAEQYGFLASQSASFNKYRSLQQNHDALQLRQFRLERKLANAEGQVVELTHLIRQIKQENLHLNHFLATALEEISFLATLEPTTPTEANPYDWSDSLSTLDEVRNNLNEDKMELAQIDALTHMLGSTYCQLKSEDLYFAASVLLKQYTDTELLAEQRASDLSSALASHEAIAARLESLQKEKAEHEDKLKAATTASIELRASVALLEMQLADTGEEVQRVASQHGVALKKEKDAVTRMASTVQKTRIAEDALRAEIETLTAELTNAERFQEAYYTLSDEVGALITRNQVSEEEADRISKFNAEILGHNNPAQRIMYVDRIRRELAEAKHKIALLNREQEAVMATNDDLQHELDMYKSVRVPLDSKPRTAITRIARPPLVNLGHLGNSLQANAGGGSTHTTPTSAISGKSASSFQSNFNEPLLEVYVGDMTTDELM